MWYCNICGNGVQSTENRCNVVKIRMSILHQYHKTKLRLTWIKNLITDILLFKCLLLLYSRYSFLITFIANFFYNMLLFAKNSVSCTVLYSFSIKQKIATKYKLLPPKLYQWFLSAWFAAIEHTSVYSINWTHMLYFSLTLSPSVLYFSLPSLSQIFATRCTTDTPHWGRQMEKK